MHKRAPRLAGKLAERGIVLVEDLKAIVAAIADIDFAVIRDFHAMHGIAEECGLLVAFSGVLNPVSGGERPRRL